MTSATREPDPVMFELLADAPTLPPLAEPRLGAIKAKWTRWTGSHKPCDQCVQLIHDHGVAGAPVPRPARHKRVGPNDTLMLCDLHGEEMQRKDAAAEAEHARRVRLAEEARKRHAGTRRK